jgi:hypothetical protein
MAQKRIAIAANACPVVCRCRQTAQRRSGELVAGPHPYFLAPRRPARPAGSHKSGTISGT